MARGTSDPEGADIGWRDARQRLVFSAVGGDVV
jgi:hypothetical protein